METDEFLTKKDDLLTRRRENAFRHMQNESDARVMPFAEEEKIAGSRYGKTKAEADMRLVPDLESEQREQARLGAGAAKVGQALLPGEEEVAGQIQERKLERAARIEDIMSNDPAERQLSQWTKDPNDLYNYRSILNRTDPKLPKAQREREAFRRSMRLVKDRDYINGLYEAVEDGAMKHEDLDQLLDVDMDDDGNFYGQYIKPDKEARARVERVIASNRLKKEKMAREKEERISSQAYDAIRLRALSERKTELARRVADFPEDQAAAADLSEINAEIDTFWKKPKGQSVPGQPANTGASKVDESARQRLLR